MKTNNFLQFAVLTGCLRVSKESIFTGLNNFKVLSITDVRFDEQFGFTEEEVRKLLADYDLEAHLPGMEKACENAIAQIKSRRYEEYLRNDGREDILFYGIAFYKKRCKVVVERAGE